MTQGEPQPAGGAEYTSVHLVDVVARCEVGEAVRSCPEPRTDTVPRAYWHADDRCPTEPSSTSRYEPSAPCDLWRELVAPIAAEHLVAAVARQADGDVLASERGHEVRGDL